MERITEWGVIIISDMKTIKSRLNWGEKNRKRLKYWEKQEREGWGLRLEKEQIESHVSRQMKGQEVVVRDWDDEFIISEVEH